MEIPFSIDCATSKCHTVHMRARTSVILGIVAAVVLSGCAASSVSPTETTSALSSDSSSATEEVFTPIVGNVLATPIAVPATDGLTHLAYELVLTNVIGVPITMESVSVEGDGAELLRLSGDDLTSWMRPSGGPTPGRVMSPGQQAVITLDVTLPPDSDTPKELAHTIEFAPESAIPPLIEKSMTQTIARTSMDSNTPIVIASPVLGDNWLDGNSCCEVTPHRGAINPVNGALYAPERFAIDFVQLDESGRIFDGANDDITSFAYYGADILAVADGPIVSMEWDLPEETPGAHPVGLELSQYGGNHIVQDIGGGHYAFYAHLQGKNPHGLSVGQDLKRGDVIGQLGNSGNTDIPHLHFHVMDSPLPLASNGLPFLIDSFTLAGTVKEPALMECMETSVPCGVDGSGSAVMKAKSPLYRDVISIAR